jgi:antitoxin (DNA-binding transcriptional repressor) of toxin-antitoxin stability system
MNSSKRERLDRIVKHVTQGCVTTLTIRDLRQRWPQAEKALETEDEILITRDGKPVAKLTRVSEAPKRRPRFDPAKHIQEINKILRGKRLPSSEASLARDRADRFGSK